MSDTTEAWKVDITDILSLAARTYVMGEGLIDLMGISDLFGGVEI